MIFVILVKNYEIKFFIIVVKLYIKNIRLVNIMIIRLLLNCIFVKY